ncbi:MAG: hypothetical protein RBU27_12915 [Bacteroidota bacterium]|jgi:hypothetical protein|nr:hypothetical protein [Bacteroidota bacterium]
MIARLPFPPILPLLLTIMATVLVVTHAPAQGNTDWEERWKITPPFPPPHAMEWMNDSLSYTRLAYDEIRDVVYVVSPHRIGATQWTAPSIHILDAETGQPRMDLGRSAHFARNGWGGELPVPLDTFMTATNSNLGFGQNWFALYNIDVDEEGRIYACNLVDPLWGICLVLPNGQCDPMYLGQGPFRVWRWDSLTATPELIYATCNTSHDAIGTVTSSEMPNVRWGDGFAVTGKRGWHDPAGGGPPVLVDSARIYVTGQNAMSGSLPSGNVAVLVEDARAATQRPARDVFGGGRLSFRLGHLMDVPGDAAAHAIAPARLTVSGDTLTRWIWLRRHGEAVYRLRERHPSNAALPLRSTPRGVDLLPISNTATLFGPSGAMQYLYLPQWQSGYLAAADASPSPGSGLGLPTPNTAARFIDVTTPGAEFRVWSSTPPVGMAPLWMIHPENYISDVDLKLVDNGPSDLPAVQLFVLMSNNGIAAYRSRRLIPIELITLAARWSDGAARVEWTVAAETDILHYVVERSAMEHGPWRVVGTVPATGGSGELRYSFMDARSPADETWSRAWYRVVAVDFDGTRKTFPAVTLHRIGEQAVPLAVSMFPQPARRAQGVVYLRLTAPAAAEMMLRVTDVLGTEVMPARILRVDAGSTVLPLRVDGLRPGFYFVRLDGGDVGRRLARLLVQ